MITLTKDNFEKEILKCDTLVFIDFWADWCMPCKMMMPIVEELAKEYQGKVKFAKVNVDEENELAERYQVMSIPTFIFMKNGKILDKVIGAVPKTILIKKLNEFLEEK
uniref:Thioredoxin n=1 Tax=candidate division WOR-3 bacterium TaxID=2052148 RepID=A0A7V3ZV71_UNCW3